jgi:hypothetical protein
MDTWEKLKYMSEGDIKEVIKIALDNLENNPDSFLQAQAEVETMIMEHPEFYERIKDLDFSEMSPEDFSEMVRITIDHNFKNSMAN